MKKLFYFIGFPIFMSFGLWTMNRQPMEYVQEVSTVKTQQNQGKKLASVYALPVLNYQTLNLWISQPGKIVSFRIWD